jgi:HflK protein
MSLALESVCKTLGLKVIDDPATRHVAEKIVELSQHGVRGRYPARDDGHGVSGRIGPVSIPRPPGFQRRFTTPVGVIASAEGLLGILKVGGGAGNPRFLAEGRTHFSEEWVVQYRISDPVKFLFDVREPRGTLRDVSESVMREVVGDRTVDEVITIGRQEIETEALAKMQALSTKYAMGISIDQVQLKNINPPEPVQVSFNEVNQAQQEKEKLINEARRDYNKVIPLAEGEKDQRIREADGYRLKRINEAEGDVARFGALLAEYIKAPEVTRRRIYIETLQDVMPGLRIRLWLSAEQLGQLGDIRRDPPRLIFGEQTCRRIFFSK